MLAAILAASAEAVVPPVDFTSRSGRLYANGAPFSIKGATWRGAEGPGDLPEGLTGIHPHSITHHMELLAQGGFNAVRITFNHQAVLDANFVEHFDPQVEPTLLSKRYLQALQMIIEAANEHDLLVTLAAARLAPRESPGNGLWHSTALPESSIMRSWTKITNVLCAQPNFFAVDLFDGPHGAAWGLGGPNLDWRVAAQRLGDQVLAGCPRLLVMVQGARTEPWVDHLAPELTPGLNLMGVKKAPIQLSNPAKLVYAPALVPPSEHMLPAYSDAAFPSNMPLIWGRQFGFVPELTGAALVLSRVGGLLDDALDRSWQDALFHWAREHGVGFFYDCLNPNPTNGGLLHKDWSTLRAVKVQLLNGLTSTSLVSVPPAAPIPPARFHSLNAADVPPEPPTATNRLCINHVRASGLRGALDWQSGGPSSGTLLSIFTGADVGPTWGTRLFELPTTIRAHAVQHTTAGDRLQLQLNTSHCFAVAAAGDAEPTFCFQIADLTQFGGHVRYVNRGCGVLQRSATRHVVTLNDGAELALGASFQPLEAGAEGPSVLFGLMLPLIAVALAGVTCLAMRAVMRSGATVQRCCLLSCARVLSIAGFVALAAEVSRGSANRHEPVPHCEPGRHGAPRGRNKSRVAPRTTVEVISGACDDELAPSAVHEITLDEAVSNQEEAIRRAMELMGSVQQVSDPQEEAATQEQ